MELKMENIGIIKNASLVLDGLTVITGKNSSGKTTIGKTLYALIDATCNLQRKAQNDRYLYIRKQLRLVEDIISEGFRFEKSPESKSAFSDYSSLYFLLFDNYREKISEQNIENFAHDVERELKIIDPNIMRPYQRTSFVRRIDKETGAFILSETSVDFEMQRGKALHILYNLFSVLDKDPELFDYARERINQTLRMEFNSQIQPVMFPNAISQIELSEDPKASSTYFRFNILKNNITKDAPAFYASPFQRVYMIDDPFILDKGSERSVFYYSNEKENDFSILNPTRIQSHSNSLRSALRNSNNINIFEQTVLNNSLQTIKDKIDCAIPGTFEFTQNGDYYIQGGSRVKYNNLATGSKMFSIIKILLEKGYLDNSTMLILDEPEAHLHPEWQNIFAEAIVLIVKELSVKILLTTHSPNFMLAIDAYMRKYEIIEKTNFYQTDYTPDGLIQYRCVNDDIGFIYEDFLKYLSEMRILRNKYLYGGSE